MAAKKYYGVKVGKTTGIFTSWDECKASVGGYPGAQYKGFPTLEEAKAYMGEEQASIPVVAPEKRLVVYVDGSFSEGAGRYAFGCVFLLPDGRIYTEFGNGNNPKSLVHRNVTGEMLGAMYAVKTAMLNGFSEIQICYDYEGIEKWVTGAWKSKTEYTQKYRDAMQGWSRSIHILFQKVPAHSNVKYNELADQMAKQGITDGNGVPKVRKLEELTLWSESD